MENKSDPIFVWALAGAAVACLTVAISALTIYSGLQEVFPQQLWSVCVFFGGPGLIAGALIKRSSKHLLSAIAGFLGIVLGVLWHLHLGELSAQIANAHYDSTQEILSSVSRLDGFFLTRWLINLEYKALLLGGVPGIAVGLTMLFSSVLTSILGTYAANNLVKKAQAGKGSGAT